MTTHHKRAFGYAHIALILAFAAPVAAQPHYPGRVQEILNTFAAMHPEMVADDRGPAPTPRFRFNQRFAEQVCFELGPSWGLKQNGSGGSVSSDVIAFAGPPLVGYEWENRHDGTVEQFPPAQDLTGQLFRPVACQNHFAATPGPPVGTGPAPPPVQTLPSTPVDLSGVLARLDSITAQNERIFANLNAQLALLREQVDAHDKKPGDFEKLLGNRYVQILLAAVGTCASTTCWK